MLLLNDALRARLTQAAPRGVERYAVGPVVDDHEALYARVLDGAPPLAG